MSVASRSPVAPGPAPIITTDAGHVPGASHPHRGSRVPRSTRNLQRSKPEPRGYSFVVENKPAMIFEIYLPRKPRYRAKLDEVLDAFLSDEELRKVPGMSAYLRGNRRRGTPAEQLRLIRQAISGFSIYDVEGRFEGGIDERSWVIRIIVHDPRLTAGMTDGLRERAVDAVLYFISGRLAVELGTEHEIWFVKYEAHLWRLIRQG